MENKIGVYLRQSRQNLKFTLREIEEKTGISNAYLSQLENSKIANPSPSVLHKLANCYNVSYLYLLKLVGYPTLELTNKNNIKTSPSFRLGNDFDNVTKQEEEKLREYLQFLRSKKQR